MGLANINIAVVVYGVAFVLGLAYFIVTIFSGDVLGLDLDFLDELPLIDFDADTDGLAGIAVSTYILIFGVVGLVTHYMGLAGFIIALLAGYVVMAIVLKIGKWALAGQSSGKHFTVTDLIHEEVQVIGNIKGGSLGEGLVHTENGTLNYAIREEKDADLKAGDVAVVVSTQGNTLIVKKKG